jgi:hypothetical protein
MGLRPCIVRSARLTARIPEYPGCFASLCSGQGAAPLALLRSYPCPLANGKRFFKSFPLGKSENPISLHRPSTENIGGLFISKIESIENQELLCRGWFLPPNTYDCGSFVVNGTAVVGKEPKKPYNRCKSTQKGAELYEISI